MNSSDCKMKRILSDKWMIVVFPIITLGAFFTGIVALFVINAALFARLG